MAVSAVKATAEAAASAGKGGKCNSECRSECTAASERYRVQQRTQLKQVQQRARAASIAAVGGATSTIPASAEITARKASFDGTKCSKAVEEAIIDGDR